MVRTILKNVGVIDCSQFPIGTKQIRKLVIEKEDTQLLSGLANCEKAEQNPNNKPPLNSGEPHIDVYEDRYGFSITEKIKLVIAINLDGLKTKWRLQIGNKDHHLMDSGVEGLRTDDERYRLIIALRESHLVTNAEEIVKDVGNKLEEILKGNEDKNSTESKSDSDIEMDIEEAKKLHRKDFDKRLEYSALPKDHFIYEYAEMAGETTEAYMEYHIVNGLWLLSALSQNKFLLKLNKGTVRLNVSALILGASTLANKTLAINKAKGIFEICAKAVLYNDDYSLEGFMERLSISTNNISHFVRDEAGGMFAKFHQKYNDGMFDAECKIYDGDSSFRKTLVSKGNQTTLPTEVVVVNPFVTYLRGTTPTRFLSTITYEEAQSGWIYRQLISHPSYKNDKFIPTKEETPEEVKKWASALERAKNLYNHINKMPKRAFHVSEDAMKYYNDLEKKIREDISKPDCTEEYSAAAGRAKVHIWKIAMLLELGKKMEVKDDISHLSTTIQLDSMKIAADWVMNYFVPMTVDIAETLRDNDAKNPILKVLSALKRLGGVATHSKLMKYSRLGRKQFAECIETLIESEDIERFKDSKSRATCYRLLNN